MAISSITPRDRLQRLLDLGGKTLRYWWLIAVFAVVGGGLSLAFALTHARTFQAEVSLGYKEKIQSSLLQNREEVVNRNIGDYYRELLLAHDQLLPIVRDPALNPFPGVGDDQIAIEKLRQAVRFESRGGATFRILYNDSDPDRAKAIADRMTKLLQDKDEAMRNDQAQATVNFALAQKEEAAAELHKRERSLAEFLAKHPEFVSDNNQSSEGASIRANNKRQPVDTASARQRTLERQRQRIQARLDAPPDAPPIRVPAPPSAERQAAEQEVNEAQRELSAANRELESAMSKFTEAHPSVINAQGRVAAAQQKLRHAQGRMPADVETMVAPATAADRTKLQKEIVLLDAQIAAEQKRTSKGAPVATDAGTKWIVDLETEHEQLRRNVNEERDRLNTLAGSVSRAQTEAQQEAKQQGRLRVINAAEKPSHPTGPGKMIFLLAGMALFLGLGTALAVGLAVIDDRLYRRYDVDQLGVAVLAVIPPAPRRRAKPAKKAAKAAKAARQTTEDIAA